MFRLVHVKTNITNSTASGLDGRLDWIHPLGSQGNRNRSGRASPGSAAAVRHARLIDSSARS